MTASVEWRLLRSGASPEQRVKVAPLDAAHPLHPSAGSGPPAHGPLDAPEATIARAALLRRHAYLRRLYGRWYRWIIARLPQAPGEVLEVGSGGGFLAEVLPGVITSEVVAIPGVERVIDARRLPFADGSLRAVVATNVLHHVPEIGAFLGECERCLAVGGRLIAIEPWPTAWSRFVYRRLHHEPFDEGRDWSLPPGGPLTAANGALPWIVLERDRAETARRFPRLRVASIEPCMPVTYLACGGIGRAWRLPGWCFDMLRLLERPFDRLGLFALLVVERTR